MEDQKSFPGVIDSLDEIRAFVEEKAQQAGLSRKATYNLLLAVDEIATNSILYGYQEAGLRGEVGLSCRQTADKLVVTLEDTAAPFDPTSRPLPTAEDLARPLEDRAVGGLGIFLTVKGVDEFSYRYEDHKNRTTFGVYLNPDRP